MDDGNFSAFSTSLSFFSKFTPSKKGRQYPQCPLRAGRAQKYSRQHIRRIVNPEVNPGKTHKEGPEINQRGKKGKNGGNQASHEESRCGVARGKAEFIRRGDELVNPGQFPEGPWTPKILFNEVIKAQLHRKGQNSGEEHGVGGGLYHRQNQPDKGTGITVSAPGNPKKEFSPGLAVDVAKYLSKQPRIPLGNLMNKILNHGFSTFSFSGGSR
ncbi:MAG TPA: hypothetical protein VMV05_01695 [bacterium]|nr:hypothetical protein [bacterium]